MASPFPKSSSTPGDGTLVAQLLPEGISGLKEMNFQYPLKLISPSPTASRPSLLVFLLSYGGGLVGGDQVNLRISVLPQAKLSIATQGHTKVFKSPAPEVVTRQRLDVTLEANSAICLLPDPVQPFGGSVYEQTQVFRTHEGASLCVLDWVTNGRSARGENWDFVSWTGRNEIWSAAGAPRLLLRDNVLLTGSDHAAMSLKHQMHGNSLVGTLFVKGPLVESVAEFFRAEFAALPRIGARDFRSAEDIREDEQASMSSRERWRAQRLKQEKDQGVLWSVAQVRGCTVVKFGAATVEAARTWVGGMIKQEGSLEQIFGEDAIMCVK